MPGGKINSAGLCILGLSIVILQYSARLPTTLSQPAPPACSESKNQPEVQNLGFFQVFTEHVSWPGHELNTPASSVYMVTLQSPYFPRYLPSHSGFSDFWVCLLCILPVISCSRLLLVKYIIKRFQYMLPPRKPLSNQRLAKQKSASVLVSQRKTNIGKDQIRKA